MIESAAAVAPVTQRRRLFPFISNRGARVSLFASVAVALMLFGWFDVRRRSGLANPSANSFTVYFTAASAIVEGAPLYDVTNGRGWPYIYPPFLAVVLAPLVPLGSPTAGMVFFLVSVGMAVGSYFGLSRIVELIVPRARLPLPHWLDAGPLLAVGLPGISCLQGGQVGILILWLMLVALRLVLENRGRRHDVAAGVLLAVAIAVKLTPALAALVLVLHLAMSAWRRAIVVISGLVAGAFLTLVAIPSLAVGPSESLRLLGTFVQRVVIERRVVGINAGSNQSSWITLPRTAEAFGWSREGGTAAAAVLAIVAFALLIAVAVRFRRDVPAERALAISIAMAMTVVISPVVWVNHYVVAAPAFLIVPLWLREHGKDPTARALMAAAVGTVVGHYAVRSFDREVMILGPGFTAWLIVALVAVALSSTGRRSPEEPAPARGSDC